MTNKNNGRLTKYNLTADFNDRESSLGTKVK